MCTERKATGLFVLASFLFATMNRSGIAAQLSGFQSTSLSMHYFKYSRGNVNFVKKVGAYIPESKGHVTSFQAISLRFCHCYVYAWTGFFLQHS